MKITAWVFMILLLVSISLSCNGKGIIIVVGQIEGPGSISESSSTDYTVSASGDSNITYQWAIDPPTSGNLTNPASESVALSVYGIADDGSVTLTVAVTSDNDGPVVRSLIISIQDVPNNHADYLGGGHPNIRVPPGQAIYLPDNQYINQPIPHINCRVFS